MRNNRSYNKKIRNITSILIFVLVSISVFCQTPTGAISGYCKLGGTPALTSGLNSSNYLQGIIPSCTVTVYLTGTTTLATIYKDGNNTPQTNPFTASSATGQNGAGSWLFFADTNQGYDIQLSGGIYPNVYKTPLTITGVYPSEQIVVPGVTKIIAGTNVTISPTTGIGNVTINSSAAGGCVSPYCVITNPTATQSIVQPATTNLNINNFEGQIWADQYGTGSNGIETSYAQCLEQNGLGYSGCSIYVSQNYTNADAPGGWAFNSSQYSNPAMSQPAGAATYDERNGTQYWQFHDPLDPITGQATGLALTTQFDKSVADKNAVMPGGSQAGNYNTVNITGGGSEFNYYPSGIPQYIGETYTYGNYTTLNDYAGGIDFLNYGYLNKRSNGDSYLFWDELTADAGILSGNSEGNGVADNTAREDPLVYTGTVNGSPATGATQISITPTIGAGTQGAMYRWLVNQSTPLDSGTHFTNSVGPQTTGSATNSAIIPPSVSDSTQNFPVSTLVQLCYPGADNGASGAAGCTSGSQPAGYVPSQNYKFTITGGSVTSGVATFSISPTSPQTTPVTLVAGQVVTLYGFSLTGSGAFLNQQHVTVLSSGLSSTQFEANVTGPDTAAVGSGYSTYSPTGYSPAASITFDVVPAYTTGGETGGLPAGFCTPSTLQSTNPSSACYMPASGVGCLTDQIETECQNFTYNSGAGTITISNLQFPHLNGAVFAYGGLAGKMVEDESSKYTGGGTSGIIDEVYPIAGSLNSTTFYYVPQRTNLGYASPALGGSVDRGDGNGGTIANGTNTATQSALCFTTTMGGFSLSGGVVTFSMGGIPGIAGGNPYPIYSGLTLTISGTGNSTYDGNYVVTNQGDAVFTYPDSGASGTVPTTGTVSYCNANYNVLDAARVSSVANPSTGSIDNSVSLFANTASFSGTIVREPHFQQISMNGTHENVTQFQQNVFTGGAKDNITYGGTISGPGWGFDVLNNGAASSYQGSGGTLLPPTAPYNAGGEWLNTLILGQAPQQSVVNVVAGNSYGLSSPLSTFSLFQMPGLPNSVAGYGLDTLCYNPYYNYSNRGNALTSGEWIFANSYGFNCLNGPADNYVISTVRMGNLIADSSISTASISAASMVTTALTNTPGNAPTVVGTPGTTHYNYYVVGNGSVGQTLPYHMGGSPDSLTNGNATLTGTNYNLLCAFYNPGFKSYDFVKDVGGVYTAVATNVAPGNGGTYGQVSNYACAADTGAALPSYTMPTSNTTGTVQGENFVDTSMTPGTSPICPNGADGSFTTTGCAAGSTLPSGTANQLLYYAASGTTVTPLTLGTNLSITSGTLNATSGGSTVGTAGQIQMVGSTAGSHAASAMTDNGTQITSTEPFSVNASTLPSQVTLNYNGVSPTVGASTAAVFAANSSGQGEVSEAGSAFSRICTAANGVCGASGAVVTNPTTTAANTIAPVSTTVTSLTINAPASTTADIFDVESNGSKDFYIDQYGNINLVNTANVATVQNSGGNLVLNANSGGTTSSVDTYEGWGGSTLAAGTIVAVSSSGTHSVVACPISCTNAVGVVDSNPSSNNLVHRTGAAAVTLDGTYTVTTGEYLCASPTTAGDAIPQTTPCATSSQIGIVTLAATSVTSATAVLAFSPPTPWATPGALGITTPAAVYGTTGTFSGAVTAPSVNNRVSACSFSGATADAQIANAFASLPSSEGTVDATCYGTTTETLAATIVLTTGQNLIFSPSTTFVPASATSDVIQTSPALGGVAVSGLTVSLTPYPSYTGAVVEHDCNAGANPFIHVNNLTVSAPAGTTGNALLLKCNQTVTSGIAEDVVDGVTTNGMITPILLETAGTGTWLNGNTFLNLNLNLSDTVAGTGITLQNGGLEIRGNTFNFFVEGNSVSGSTGISFTGTEANPIQSNIFTGSVFDVTSSFSPGSSNYGTNSFSGNFDAAIVDAKSVVFDLFHKNTSLQNLNTYNTTGAQQSLVNTTPSFATNAMPPTGSISGYWVNSGAAETRLFPYPMLVGKPWRILMIGTWENTANPPTSTNFPGLITEVDSTSPTLAVGTLTMNFSLDSSGYLQMELSATGNQAAFSGTIIPVGLGYMTGITSSLSMSSAVSAPNLLIGNDTDISVTSNTQTANSCSTPATATITGVTTSGAGSHVSSGYTSDPATLIGWGTTGGMVFHIWPSAANTVSWEVCNQTGSSITYSAITFSIGVQ